MPPPSRPAIAGPDVPIAPFPVRLSGPVQHGFGRGGKDLGCPTANLPDDAVPQNLAPGVYFGYAQVPSHPLAPGVYPMAMSLGWNPFYKNEKLTVEIHVMHDFGGEDFYGRDMKAVVLGWVRDELDYTSRG